MEPPLSPQLYPGVFFPFSLTKKECSNKASGTWGCFSNSKYSFSNFIKEEAEVIKTSEAN